MTMESRRTLRVTGKGSLRLKPDMTRITMTVSDVQKEYAKALEASARETEQLKETLLPFGFARGDLKTIAFDVNTEYESYEEEGQYRQRFKGYRYQHVLKVEFSSDNERLGKILYALANGAVAPELRLSYTVRDREGAKNRLLANAVEDAKAKAALLAQAAGVTLQNIQSIDYALGAPDFEVSPMARNMTFGAKRMAAEAYDMDIEPDDIEVADTVTLVYAIA